MSHPAEPSDDVLDDFEQSPEGHREEKRRRRRPWLIVLTVLLVILALIAAAAGIYLWTLERTFYSKSVQVDTGTSDQVQGAGQNILLLGSDSRGADAAKQKVYGQRSDTIMVVHLAADKKSAYVISIPRDTYVDIPGRSGKDKINAALAYGGVPLATRTVENYVGVKMDHVVLVNFDGVKEVIDSLGGVDVHVDQNFVANGITYTQGLQHMDGNTALVYSRARYMLKDGDFGRNRHQRQLLAAIAEKVISADTLTDPVRIQSLVSTIAPYLTFDNNLTPSKIVSMAYDHRGLRTTDIKYLSAPYGKPSTTKQGASVVLQDDAAMPAFRKALKEDQMAAYYALPTTKR